MMGKEMETLKEMICMELEEIAQKGEMSAGDLDTVYKLIISKEKLLRIEELEEGLGYSQYNSNSNSRSASSYGRGNSYDGGSYSNSYANSYSNRGGHYVRGHYSRSGYSMSESKQMLMDQMQEMLNDQNTAPPDKTAIERAMEQLR